MNKPKLLLHICCGVCGSHVPSLLIPEFNVTGYFENSNIYPYEEFIRRQKATKTMTDKYNIELIIPEYKDTKWYKAVRGLSQEPEGGKRCTKCIAYRLEETFKYAKKHNFEWVASTLSVGRMKNADTINQIGHELAKEYSLNFYEKNWRKQNGEAISQIKAREACIYRQNYCGCVFSYTEKQKRIKAQQEQLKNQKSN